MSPELEQLLEMMLVVCLHRAARVPTPQEPAPPEWEREADEFCLRFARTQEAEAPSPEVAAAMIHRLRYARLFGGVVESTLEQQARLGDAAATERALLEELLVTLWRETIRPKWLRGELE